MYTRTHATSPRACLIRTPTESTHQPPRTTTIHHLTTGRHIYCWFSFLTLSPTSLRVLSLRSQQQLFAYDTCFVGAGKCNHDSRARKKQNKTNEISVRQVSCAVLACTQSIWPASCSGCQHIADRDLLRTPRQPLADSRSHRCSTTPVLLALCPDPTVRR